MGTLSLIAEPKNIIVRCPNWLGDLVMATPVLADLRHQWPKAKITALCQESVSTLIQKDPHVDEILKFNKSDNSLYRFSPSSLINSLRKNNYDLGILLTHSFSSAWLFWRGCVKKRLGYANLENYFLLSHPFYRENPSFEHLVKTYKMLLKPLGIALSLSEPQLYVTSQEQLQAQISLKFYQITAQDTIIGINPGAAYGSAKCWLPERFEALSYKLLKNPSIKILFFGDKSATLLMKKIFLKLPERVIDLTGKTSLREFIALTQSCHLFITNDSGPMHIASALKIPLIALFGSTSELKTGPYSTGVVLNRHVSCSPCYRRECPIDFRCMTRIEVSEVYDEAKKIIHSLCN